jgi:tetratricopeptide (TPR) repeat protein
MAQAEHVLATVKARFPKEISGYVGLGRLYASQKKYEAALKEFDDAAKLAPGEAAPILEANGMLIGAGRLDDAAARIEALERSNPASTLIPQLRGDLAVPRHDLVGAERAYRQWIAASPSDPRAYQSLARVRLMRDDLAGALEVLSRGEKANPQDRSTAAVRAEWLARAGRYGDAIAVYESLLERAPGDDAVANNLAYLLAEKKGDKVSLERALQLTVRFEGSSNASYLDSLGWVRYRLGQYERAVPVLERAVTLAESPLLDLHFGMALHKAGDAKRSVGFLRKAVDSKVQLPQLGEARQILAQG